MPMVRADFRTHEGRNMTPFTEELDSIHDQIKAAREAKDTDLAITLARRLEAVRTEESAWRRANREAALKGMEAWE